LKVDVLVTDLEMPRLNGYELIRDIRRRPGMRGVPVVVLTTRAGEKHAALARELGVSHYVTKPVDEHTLVRLVDALVAASALETVDFVAKPSFTVDLGLEALRDEIVSKVRMASRVRPVRTASRATAAPPSAVVTTSSEPPNEDRRHWEATPCVLMAASTGGPAALLSLVPRLGGDFPAPVLVVQHMPAPYTTAFAGELAGRCALRVKEAVHGDWIERGVASACPGSHHLTLAPGGRVVLHAPPTRDSEC